MYDITILFVNILLIIVSLSLSFLSIGITISIFLIYIYPILSTSFLAYLETVKEIDKANE